MRKKKCIAGVPARKKGTTPSGIERLGGEEGPVLKGKAAAVLRARRDRERERGHRERGGKREKGDLAGKGCSPLYEGSPGVPVGAQEVGKKASALRGGSSSFSREKRLGRKKRRKNKKGGRKRPAGEGLKRNVRLPASSYVGGPGRRLRGGKGPGGEKEKKKRKKKRTGPGSWCWEKKNVRMLKREEKKKKPRTGKGKSIGQRKKRRRPCHRGEGKKGELAEKNEKRKEKKGKKKDGPRHGKRGCHRFRKRPSAPEKRKGGKAIPSI